MKICYISSVFGPLKMFVLPQAEFIHKAHPEWEISFICNYDKQFSESLQKEFKYIPSEISDKPELKGIKAITNLKKIFKKEKYDMVIYVTPTAALYASIAGKSEKIPNRVYLQWGIVYVSRKGLNRLYHKCIEKMICKNSTSIQPDSEKNLEFCRKEKLYGCDKSCVIWNGSAKGIDLTQFDISKKEQYREEIRKQYNISIQDIFIGYVGKLSKEKGCEELISAFEEISSKKSNIKLLFIGSVDKEPNISSEIYNYFQNDENIIKTGNVQNVEKFFSAMDVFDLPSYREGFGMSVLEAQAMAVPVVVTEYPGPECAVLNGQSGYLVKLYSVDDIVNAVTRIAFDKALMGKLGAEGRRFVEDKFEQKQFMAEMLKNRENLLKNNKVAK